MNNKDQKYSNFATASIFIALLPVLIYIAYGLRLFNFLTFSPWYLFALILIISLILGFIGLKQSKEKKLKGMWLAVTSIIISIFLLVFVLSLIIGGYYLS